MRTGDFTNMFRKKLCVAFIAFLLLHDTVQGKKSRKNKRPKPDEEDNTPQPSVVSYSTFGFNDVGTYEGFVPSSPDYAKFLTGVNQETNAKDQTLSSFSSSSDSNDYGNSFNSQPYSGQSFNINEGGGSEASLIQYPPSSIGVFNSPSFDTNIDQHRQTAEEIYGRNTDEVNAPSYGTKLSSRNKRPVNEYTNTNFSGPQNDEKYSNFNEAKPVTDNRPFNEAKPTYENSPSHSEYNNPFSNAPSYPATSVDDNIKPASSEPQNPLKFQRVVDFTKLKQYYPTDLDVSRLPTATPIPDLYEQNYSSQNIFANPYNDNNNKHVFSPVTKHRETDAENNNEDTFVQKPLKPSKLKENYNNYKGYSSENDNSYIPNFEIGNKKKIKPWPSDEHNFKKWKEPTPAKGYAYSTNYSSMSFKYDADENKFKKPLGSGIDELIPASSNIDLPNYQFPETDFSQFKKMPEYKVHEEDEFENFPSVKERYKPNEFDYNQYKHLFSTMPTTTDYWGNAFKSSEYASLKSHQISNKYKYRDNDKVVNIPRRPNKYNHEKPFETKQNEWAQYNRRPHKNRPYKDWTSEVSTTRFKSEEDLLGLRNQDTSHPSYLPSYHPSNFISDEADYKKLVDKWRQSYWKSKYKDSLRDYESYGTETKPMHVPVPKPYPVPSRDPPKALPEEHTQPIMNLQIEVPHPVIVPVPQPYPVRVPIAKPVAVPFIRELKIPIEKPMPYPVYKDVPYPVEKLVPVRVEKEVPVPVVKPYPVHIPYIKPVFHHTKSRDEYDSDHRDDEDYMPRPEMNKHKYSQYKKKIPNGTRNRPRRPSRNAYQDRNRRRWPDRRHPADMRDELPRTRPIELRHPSPFKRRNSEGTRFEDATKKSYVRV